MRHELASGARLELHDRGGALLRERNRQPPDGRALEREDGMTAKIAVGALIAGLLFAFGVLFGAYYSAIWAGCGG